MATLKADRRLYVTSDRSEIVEEDDPRGAWLLAAEGRPIGPSDVERYSLSLKNGRVYYDGAPGFPEAKQAAKPEDKMAAAPENKAAESPEPEEDDEGLDDVDLSALTKDDLVALAEDRGVEVTREDGEDAPPLKSDYIRALS